MWKIKRNRHLNDEYFLVVICDFYDIGKQILGLPYRFNPRVVACFCRTQLVACGIFYTGSCWQKNKNNKQFSLINQPLLFNEVIGLRITKISPFSPDYISKVWIGNITNDVVFSMNCISTFLLNKYIKNKTRISCNITMIEENLLGKLHEISFCTYKGEWLRRR